MTKKTLFPFVFAVALLEGSAFAATSTRDFLKQSEGAISTGNIHVAQDLLKKAGTTTEKTSERWLITIASADALLRNGQMDKAEEKLMSVYQQVKDANNPAILSEILQRQGHIATAQYKTQQSSEQSKQLYKQLTELYKQAIASAEQAGDYAQIASTLINLVSVSKDPALLARIADNIHSVNDPKIKQQLQLSLGYQATQLDELKLAHQLFQSVISDPVNTRFKAQALGYTADLYAKQQRTKEALQLIDQALLSDSSPDLQLDWNWKKARFLVTQSKYAEALTAYRSAVAQLQHSRIDIPVVYTSGESSFNKTFSPLYSEYIDVLLQQSKNTSHDQKQLLLEEVLQTWEALKTVELRDYFRDACSVKQQEQSQIIEPGTAVLYPMLLSDKMALVIRFSDHIKAYPIQQTPEEVLALVSTINKTINHDFVLISQGKIATPRDISNDSHTLYQWLIAPISADLQQQKIETLVYLPDSGLRKIPFALLYDGKHYLTEKYALVTTPGLSLLATQSGNINKKDILLAGMSKPGPVVDEYLNLQTNSFGESDAGLRGLNSNRVLRAKLKESLALPGVTEELKILSSLSTVEVMENTGFLRDSFIHNVHQGHSIIHIASHGLFSGDPEKSFIMTYDHLLNMKQLTELFQNEAANNKPVELVSLSACQTAEGDDRSPLGLSGVVVQTGVKSAIGTLWPAVDEVAKQFFSDFYKFYQQPNTTKAQAMQKAQLGLMKNKDLNYPAYWAPFVLVGEWH